MTLQSAWIEPAADTATRSHLTPWYEEAGALEKVAALPHAKSDWNMSPNGTDIRIQATRVLNFGFIIGAIAAAPAAVAFTPLTTFICVAAAAALAARTLYISNAKIARTAIESSLPAPEAVQNLCKTCFNRAGLPVDKLDTVVVHPSHRANSALGRQLPSTVAVTNYNKRTTVLIGVDALEKLSMDEMEAALCHETSHVKNELKAGRTLIEQTALRAPLLLMVASICTGNLSGIVYYLAIRTAATAGAMSISRADECRADRNAVGLSGKADALISGLDKLGYLIRLRAAKGNPFKAAKMENTGESIPTLLLPYPKPKARAAYIRKIGRRLPKAPQAS